MRKLTKREEELGRLFSTPTNPQELIEAAAELSMPNMPLADTKEIA